MEEEYEEPSDTETLAIHLRTLGVQKEIQTILLTAIKNGFVSFDLVKKSTAQFSREGTLWLIALLEHYNVAILRERGMKELQDCMTHPEKVGHHPKQGKGSSGTKKKREGDITDDHGRIRFRYKGQWCTRLQEAEWSDSQGIIMPTVTAVAIERVYQHEEEEK